MSDYGIHMTRYEKLNNNQLYSLYCESAYSKLTVDEKLDLLQETVNRDALERGEVMIPEVRFANLPVNESGNACNGIIYVNYDLAVRGIQTFEYNGQTIEHNIEDYNIQTLNTVLHENTHCLQDQIINGTVVINDNMQLREYQANAFTTSVVNQNGNYQLGSQYLYGESPKGYYMYYFQPTERDAYIYAEEKTQAIINEIASSNNMEKSFIAYEQTMKINGYHAKEQEAIQQFRNLNFVKDLSQVLQNQYWETNIPVDLGTENAVKIEMIDTYNKMQQQIFINMEQSREEVTSTPVSLDEYNENLMNEENVYSEQITNNSFVSVQGNSNVQIQEEQGQNLFKSEEMMEDINTEYTDEVGINDNTIEV